MNARELLMFVSRLPFSGPGRTRRPAPTTRPLPESGRVAPSADRSELAGIKDAALEARLQRGRCRRTQGLKTRSGQLRPPPPAPPSESAARRAERGSNSNLSLE